MELKKLYNDTVVLCKCEMPLHDFLLYCDIAARSLLAKYPKKLIMPDGEYISPEGISDALALDSEFYTAMLYFVAGSFCGSENYLRESERAAEAAYLRLWRLSARGKRMKGDRW